MDAAARIAVSTNVRSATHGVVRAALTALSRTAPSLAAEAASRLFLLVPPARRLRGEAAAFLGSGEVFQVRSGSRRLRAWSWGRGPAIVLAHGWGGRAAQMRGFVPALVRAGYRVVAFDGPAHGSSRGLSASLPAFADALADVAATTGARAAVAHSLGGMATLVALSRGLGLERAVILGAPSNAERVWQGFSRTAGLNDRVAEEARRRLERRVGAQFADLNVTNMAGRITAPVLVIHDRDDAEVPWSCGEENARLLPQARLATTSGLGHRAILRDPGVVDLTVRFLAEGILPARCESCLRALGAAGTAALCGSCVLGRELFDRESRFAA